MAELFVNAPPDVMPVPFNVNTSAVPSEKPFKSRTAPAVTEVPAPVVPSGVFVPPPAAPSFNVPALIVVKPVNVLAPESVHVPVPLFVTVPEVVPMILATLPLPVPPRVNVNVAPVIVPAFVILISPEFVAMVAALPRVINPL